MADRGRLIEMQQMITRNRKRWIIAAGIVVVAVIATVLVIVSAGEPDDNGAPDRVVLATVNGEEITEEEVSRVRLRMFSWDGVLLETEEVLEQLISQRLLFREAERRDLVPTIEETEAELLGTLPSGMTLEALRQIWREEGIIYDDYLEYYRVTLAITRYLDATIEVPAVTEEELMALYEGYREYHGQRSPEEEPPTFEEMRSTLAIMFEEQERQKATYLLLQELRSQADIQYMEREQ